MTAPGTQAGFLRPESCALTRRVLRDDARQAEFDEIGFVTVDLLERSDVDRLRCTYLDAASRPGGMNPDGAYNDTYAEFSVIHSHPEVRRCFFDDIVSVLTPRVDAHLIAYRPIVANFVNKPPGTGVVPAHQNWSLVDESRFQSVSVWVALVDCVMANGAMQLLPGSHRHLRGRRGMWAYAAYSGIEPDLLGNLLDPVFVSAGQAIILDDAVVHYSPPNETDEPRLAIQYVMVPAESDAIFHQQVGGTDEVLEVDVWRVDEQFFFDFWHGDGDGAHGEVIERVAVPIPELDLATIEGLLGCDDRAASHEGRWRDRLRHAVRANRR